MTGPQVRVLEWYGHHARALPWRAVSTTPWQVVVSEFMLQQTPVARVLPAYDAWVRRWPTPASLAAAPTGEAVHAWGRLGYPRRALRLHTSASMITDRHGGQVPLGLDELRTLPGVGEYTAAAIAAFAHRQRHAVLDTNVRRVLSRVIHGRAAAPGGLTVAERAAAAELLPADPEAAAQWSVAVMELGALVCTALAPSCEACPLSSVCRWRAAGYPAPEAPRRRRPAYEGTDRQCRGRLLAVVRESPHGVGRDALEAAWADVRQRERALDGLIADGLVQPLGDGRAALPGVATSPHLAQDA